MISPYEELTMFLLKMIITEGVAKW